MFKVLVADNCAQEGIDLFKEFSDIQVDVNTGLTPDELVKIIGNYDGLVVRSATKFKGEVLGKATKMKVVGRAGAGVDNIDVETCSKKGIIVMNTPGGNSAAVAELTIAVILGLSRNIGQAVISMKEGKWEKKLLAKTSVEVAGKTLGLLGAGNIGSIVAQRAQALKMNVIVFDPFLTEEKAAFLGVARAETMDDVFKIADYISLHLPKNEQTINLINKDTIAKMKDGVYIINCARGGIVNEEDLVKELDSGKVKGAAFDVYATEPPAKDNPLINHPKTICTPHLGASSHEAQVNVAVAVAKQIGNFLTTGEITNAINVPSLDSKTRELLAPDIELAKKMGDLYRQFANLNITEITIEYFGEVCGLPNNPITTSLLIGLLKDSIEGLNFVNAIAIAKERGIKIKEIKNEESEDYASQVTLNVTHSDGTTSITGAVFKEGRIRIVGVDDFIVDFIPTGNLLLAINEDVPGFIGQIGSIIGEQGLNIANMELGRNIKKNRALSFIQIDGEITDSLLDKIKTIKSLESIHSIKM